jgi:DNA-binding NarL/FixJ family response regulator
MCPVKRRRSVLLVDDHPMVRAGLREILEESDQWIELTEAATAAEGLARVREASWELVLLDESLPNGSGLAVLKRIKSEFPKLPVLIISAHPEEELALPALKAGAAGFLNKAADPMDLLAAVRSVLAGKRYISRGLAERLAQEFTGETESDPHEHLSERELQVFRAIAAGRRPAEIAAELCLSPRTVQTYRARVIEKLGVKGSAGLIRYAYKHHLIE